MNERNPAIDEALFDRFVEVYYARGQSLDKLFDELGMSLSERRMYFDAIIDEHRAGRSARDTR